MMTAAERPDAEIAARPRLAVRRQNATLARLGMVAAIILGAGYVLGLGPAETDRASGNGPVVGAPAPGLVLSTIDGRVVNLADLRGRPVWLTFGASWCQACRAESPDIEAAFQGATDEDLAVIAVFISEDKTTVADFARLVGLTYEIVADPDRDLAGRYRVVGLPSHFFIDRLGVVHDLRIGSLDPAGMQQELGEILR